MTRIFALILALAVTGCAPKDCKLPDGSPAGFIQNGTPGHQVQPAGTTGQPTYWFEGCPR